MDLHVVQLVRELRVSAADHEDLVVRFDVLDEILAQLEISSIPLKRIFSFVEELGPIVFLREVCPTFRQQIHYISK